MKQYLIRKLQEIYLDKGIAYCEVRLNNCMINFGLSFHHRHKRIWYKKQESLLAEFDQTILTCASCHGELERDRNLHYKIFKKLRDEIIK